jgi:hypothetical protein
MFGKNGSGDEQPQATGSLWGDMFGLSGLMKVITDPALVEHAHGMMQATIEGANANRRIEAKLDRLLQALGHEIDDINSRFPAAFGPQPAALLVQHRTDGTGGNPAATGVAHDGSGGAAASPRPAGATVQLHRDDDPTGELQQ